MPFTAAHVAAVLPAVHWQRRLRIDPTCLVIGSMVPDFEYFVRGEQVSSISHTFVGLLVWCLPMTLILAALYHHVVKWPVLLAAPRRLLRAFGDTEDMPAARTARGLFAMVVGSLLGASTHLLWDGATHARGLFVRAIPELRARYVAPVIGETALHRILQHTSTLVGLAIVVAYVAPSLLRRPIAIHVEHRRRAQLTFAIVIAVCVGLMQVRLHLAHLDDPGSIIVGTISGLLAGTVLASILLRDAGRAFREAARAQGAPLSDTARQA
ncbi:MAG: DUF4184 family protein [Kofleriaceae bacterium]